MELLTIIVIAVGLAMDAFAVSVAAGAGYRKLRIHHVLRMAAFFGAFQAVMPILGWLAGLSFRAAIDAYDHWVAFAILVVIGVKMLYEAFKIKQAENPSNPANLAILLTLSVATSIDALAVGVTLSLITDSIAMAVVIIGLVTFVLSYCGCIIGKRIGHLFENRIEILGGCILIAMGLKILISHLIAAN
ncbi:MAG: manganese efflux pump [Phycisphaerae bacterium]|nr:manganese efflux pump [Phycisphaerae bacterium]